MSERLALMQLQNELRGASVSDREAWRAGIERLGFADTLLENRIEPSGERAKDPFVAALGELSAPPDGLDRQRPDEVAPIEKLALLIRLSKGKTSRTRERKLAVRTVAKTLLAPADREEPEQLTMLLDAIDRVGEENQQVIRIPDLDGAKRLELMTRPQGPRIASGSFGTVQDVLRAPAELRLAKGPADYLRAPAELRLAKGLADCPVVDVDTCIYKAIVDGQAEYVAHLRTTIRFEHGTPTVGRFKALLEPELWPQFNRFWLGMTKILPTASPKGAPAAPTTAQEAASTAVPYVKYVSSIGWKSLGMYLEQVGFNSGPKAAGKAGKAGNVGKAGQVGLYPDTYLFFSRGKRTKDRALMTYTLLRRLPPLCVDDGCIEIKKTDKRVDVITTKSLYVSGVGSDTELAGILAYLAAYCGWGTNTLSLVYNAALK